jgi:hypothetical protein
LPRGRRRCSETLVGPGVEATLDFCQNLAFRALPDRQQGLPSGETKQCAGECSAACSRGRHQSQHRRVGGPFIVTKRRRSCCWRSLLSWTQSVESRPAKRLLAHPPHLALTKSGAQRLSGFQELLWQDPAQREWLKSGNPRLAPKGQFRKMAHSVRPLTICHSFTRTNIINLADQAAP